VAGPDETGGRPISGRCTGGAAADGSAPAPPLLLPLPLLLLVLLLA